MEGATSTPRSVSEDCASIAAGWFFNELTATPKGDTWRAWDGDIALARYQAGIDQALGAGWDASQLPTP